MKRRIIAALMCLCMLVGLLPMSAFAADPGTVTATKDVISQTPDKNGNYTIKLTVQGEPVEIPSESAADVVLVVDNSGSMASSVGDPCLTPKSEFDRELTFLWYRYTCPNCGARYSSSLGGWLWDTRPNECTGQIGAEPRIDTAKKVSKTFAGTILNGENDNQLAVIGFAHNQDNGGANDSGALFVRQGLTNNLTQANSAIDKMDADGGTNYSAALQQAYDWLNEREDTTRPAYVIFISDGAPGRSGESIGNSRWDGSDQATALKRDGVTLYTIGIALTDDESNYLESLATDPNHYINVTGTNYATQLEEVLLEWASHINSVPAGKNAVMTDVVNTEYFDVVTPLPAGVTLGGDGKTLVWNIGAIPKDGTSVEITIKPKADVLNTITGTKTVNTNTNVSLTYVDYNGADQTIPKEQIGDPTVNLIGTKPAEYLLTYEGNAQSGGTVENLPASAQYPTGRVTLSTQKPTHTPVLINPGDEKATDVLFIGWTEEPTTKIYAEGDGAPTTVATVTMTEAGKTVYAAWGYDANGNGKPDVTENGYTLTYDGNALGGDVFGIPTDINNYLVNADVALITNPEPTHTAVKVNPDDEKATAVVFVGWTEERTEKIFAKGDIAPTTVASVTMIEGGKTVYAAWGYDANGDGNPDVNENGYKLTYYGNAQQEGTVENVPTDDNTYLSGVSVTLSSQEPTHSKVNDTAVVFVGWTSEQTNKIYSKNDAAPTTVTSVNMVEGGKNVYAAWGYDTDGDGNPDVTETKYTLTYHANGGTDITLPTDNNKYLSGETVNLSTKLPERADVDGKKVECIGWSTTPDSKIYAAGENYGTLPTTVTFADQNIDVYAVWGYDTTNDGVADATQVIIQPAPITIYTGGDGYTGVVTGENGNTVGATTEGNGLPIPGFYFTLPYALDQAIKLDAGSVENAADLSKYLEISTDRDASTGTTERVWSIHLYNETDIGSSSAYSKYVYCFQTDEEHEDQPPLRMQFRGADGNIIYSDEFEIGNALHQEYTMSLYAGSVTAAHAVVTIAGEKQTTGIGMASSTLTIRGVVDENAEPSEIGSTTPSEAVETITATTESGKVPTYYINGSQIPVTNQDGVKLLSDEVLDSTVTVEGEETTVHKALLDMAADELTGYENVASEFKYLDLVDASNGNVWVTMGQGDSLTVYWPYPAGTDKNDSFTLVHYKGLDRDFDLSNLDEQQYTLEVLSTENGTLVCTDKGIKFTVNSFSPFALVYNAKAPTVDVTFDAGDHGTLKGDGTVAVEQNGKLTSTQIPGISADTYYTFTGWKSSVDNKIYSNDELTKLTITGATTFVAQYQYYNPGSGYDHYVYYYPNFNGGSVRNEGFDTGDTVTVKENTWLERDGYVFVCWNTEADGSGTRYDPDDTFTMPDHNVYLYAQWQKEKPGPDDTGVSDWLETEEHNAYLTGYPDSTFRADRNMTRAEVAQMFYALLLDKNVTITKSFSDVPDDAWYATAVKTLASLDMMDGYPDGTFRPDEPITRAEFATVGLAFAYDPIDADCSYYDVSASAWYHTYVAQATTYGWIGGYPDNTFRPGNNITRVEVCVIVNNMLGRDADERYIDRNEDELVHFVDLSDSYWGYYTIMESTNNHEYTGSFTNEKWTDVK